MFRQWRNKMKKQKPYCENARYADTIAEFTKKYQLLPGKLGDRIGDEVLTERGWTKVSELN